MNANGSYTYIANRDAADPLDPGDTVTDTFTYTVDDQMHGDDMQHLQLLSQA